MTHENSMKVLWITHVPAPYRLPIFNELSEQVNLEVMYLQSNSKHRGWTLSEDSGYKAGGFPVIKLFWENYRFLIPRPEASQYLKKFDCIVVGGWDSPVFLYSLWFGNKNKIKTYLFHESTLGSRRFNRGPVSWVRNWAFRAAEKIIVPGIEARDSVAFSVPGLSQPIVAFNPIDVSFFTRFKNEAGSSNGHKYLYVGRFIRLKNVDGLIRAFSRIANSGDTLTIAGFGEEEENLKKLATQLAPSQINFIGKVEYKDLPALYLTHHTQILPSKEREVWGMVTAEALSMGLHAVVSDQCGILASVADFPGVFGFSPLTQENLEKALVASRSNWRGPLDPKKIQESASPATFVKTLRESAVFD